jgi:hypothetical protein
MATPDLMAAPTPPDKPRCTATSKQTGQRCAQRPIPGGTVCRFHGGAAPQVQRTARQRLQALADPAVGVLERFVNPVAGQALIEPEIALRAAKDVLDRTGFKAVTKIQVTKSIDPRRLTDDELEMARALAHKLKLIATSEDAPE